MKRQLFPATLLVAFTVVVGCNGSTETASDTPNTDNRVVNEGDQQTPASPATEPMDGFALISPLRSTKTYLLNMDKDVVHSWGSEFPPREFIVLAGERRPDARRT